MAYATVTELKNELGKGVTDDDTVLVRLLDTATRNIDDFCNRPDGFVSDTTATARLYMGNNEGFIRIDEFTSITQLRVKPAATSDYEIWTSADYITCAGDRRFPDYNPTVKGKPYTALRADPNGDYTIFYQDTEYPTVEVTACWGYATSCPPTIKTACIMQAVRWYKRLKSGMSDTLASVDAGLLMYTQTLDPDIQRLLRDGRYIRPQL
jgi:hypothetical protein